MKSPNAEPASLKDFLIKALSSFFFVGYIPFAPGTFGSLAAFIVYFYLVPDNLYYMLVITFALIVAGIYLSHKGGEIFGSKDPSKIVIDEVAGYFVSVLFLPKNLTASLLAFIFFRIFDIFKIFPANLIDRNMEGGTGVVMDDVVAGIYANVATNIVLKLL